MPFTEQSVLVRSVLMVSRSKAQKATTITLLIANLCLLVLYLSAWTYPLAQNNRKKVVQPVSLDQPVEIQIEHRGQRVKANEEFDGDDDWFKNLKIKIKNRSEKSITYVVLDLTFPETATPENSRVGLHQIRLGESPDLKSNGAKISLAPGDSKEISLDLDYSEIKKLVESRIPAKNITNLVVRLETAVFSDDTKWFAGTLYQRNPNPNHPHKWIPVSQ